MSQQCKLYLLIALLVGINYFNTVNANNPSADKQLKVLTWNIYSLPFIINTTNRTERAKGVVEALEKSVYDVIVFQETFHKKSFQILEEGLAKSFPYAIKVERHSGFLNYHHGIYMVSKYPLNLLGTIAFKRCDGTDCLSRKGAILVELEKQGQVFQVLGTHLQSGIKNKREKIRASQRLQLLVFLKAHYKPKVPQLLCGDFNTDFNNPKRRKALLKDLEIEPVNIPYKSTWPNVYNSTKTSQTYILDYIFFKKNGFRIKSKMYQALSFFNKKKKFALSDHKAVELILDW